MNNDNEVVAKGNPKYKDALFRFIFGKEERKEYALQLYNALNNSTEEDANKLTFTTLEDVVFLGIKNDLSFVIDSQWNLYEEQSTWNPKMPYRMLKYVVKQYTRYVAEKGYDEYSPTMFYLPAPKFVVFYNGTDKNIDETVDLKLSSMYLGEKNGDLELSAKVYNISEGKNKELKEKCKPLFEYSWIVTNIRKNTSMYGTDVQGIAKSVEKTIEDMPSDFVLYKLLKAEKEEVIGMIREEYTYEDMAKSHKRELKNTVLNIAISFLKNGCTPEFVAKNTGLPLEEVKELKETAEDIVQTRGDEIMTLEQKFEDIKYISELEKSQEIAERMIKRGYPIEDICDVTGLSGDQVFEIKKSINQ